MSDGAHEPKRNKPIGVRFFPEAEDDIERLLAFLEKRNLSLPEVGAQGLKRGVVVREAFFRGLNELWAWAASVEQDADWAEVTRRHEELESMAQIARCRAKLWMELDDGAPPPPLTKAIEMAEQNPEIGRRKPLLQVNFAEE